MKKRKLHTELRVGAIVRVEGFAPAVVLSIEYDTFGFGCYWVTVRHTANRSAHGFTDVYKRGMVRVYRSEQCPPRDTIETRRGRYCWPLPRIASAEGKP